MTELFFAVVVLTIMGAFYYGIYSVLGPIGLIIAVLLLK